MKIAKITPTGDQAEALEKIKNFLASDKKEFCLSGRGGTGKTTVIREAFRGKNDEIKGGVLGMTVTHKARLNLMGSLPECTTYASGMGLTMEVDDMGNIIFVPKKNYHLIREKLMSVRWLIFDECSMVSKEMYDIIHLSLPNKTKIIWLGDHHQLPPIDDNNGDNDSLVFDVEGFELKKFIRQKEGDTILKLCNELCDAINTDHNLSAIKRIKTDYDNEKKKGVFITTEDKTILSFVKQFKANEHSIITAYRNKTVNRVNKKIRKELWGVEAKNTYLTGDRIIMNNQFAPGMETLAYNGQEFIIKEVSYGMVRGVECFMLKVEDWLELPIPTVEGKKEFFRTLYELKNEARKTKKWQRYMSFVSEFADVVYGYCVTNYKVQGSTYKTIYVDVKDVLSITAISDKRKLQALYVGFSRPTNNLAIF